MILCVFFPQKWEITMQKSLFSCGIFWRYFVAQETKEIFCFAEKFTKSVYSIQDVDSFHTWVAQILTKRLSLFLIYNESFPTQAIKQKFTCEGEMNDQPWNKVCTIPSWTRVHFFKLCTGRSSHLQAVAD